jgi:hypothetical protein
MRLIHLLALPALVALVAERPRSQRRIGLRIVLFKLFEAVEAARGVLGTLAQFCLGRRKQRADAGHLRSHLLADEKSPRAASSSEREE